MRCAFLAVTLAGVMAVSLASEDAFGACCYFSAIGQDVNQPAQKAFITWDPAEEIESFTVQPKFEGDARNFGMVVPTPSRPRLYEMPREFFKELAVFTILRPMPLDKYKRILRGRAKAYGVRGAFGTRRDRVRVIESGVVGTLDYKIVVAERSSDLYEWLKDNKYSYAGDEATLDHYIRQKWYFTVMKIDPMQQKRRRDGAYTGEVTPTRFTFATAKPIYPLRITQISVKRQTEVLLYVQAPYKVDMPGKWSYEPSWTQMWHQASKFAVPKKLTRQEKAWQPIAEKALPDLQQLILRQRRANPRWQPARLEWAKKLTSKDMGMIAGTYKFDRQADAQAIRQLRLLQGHLRLGRWVTKCRKVFLKEEMSGDIEFVRATVGGRPDEMEYVYALPTSPP